MSTLEKKGIQNLYEEITKLYDLDKLNIEGENIVTNVRHQNLINKADESVNKAIEAINENIPLDIVAIYIKDILECIGKITGENVSENIINEIFSKFR